MSKKEYTFKDWKNGIIESDYQNGFIENVKSDDFGRLIDKVYKAGHVSEAELDKIKQAQQETFFNAVDITVNALIENFKESLRISPDPEALLLEEKKLLNDYLDNAPNHDYREVLKGGWSSSGINHRIYKLVEELKGESTIIHIANPSSIPDDNLRERGLEHVAGLVNMVTEKLFPEVDLPKSSEAFNLNNYVRNDYYHIAVYVKFLNELKDLEAPGVSSNTNSLLDPEDAANAFIKQSRNTRTQYSKEEYIHVMKYARDNPEVVSISKLIRDLKDHPECPQKIKPKGKAKNSIRNWIEFYDQKAGIKRK
ncbi:hypothetical protein G3570_03195 [Balneolaceae bacterium YR4-1]|uniref:Uncharacterized protein n=1 Tax=Halalkalibaculum roseum TaxID=2709311 RepID=A0A6M1SS93_9BACT|nr:hypothetical protein [Halalkalibaculum roseum]NGP75622.1 hypothetical protein [Halalkalibaculum roseum]